MTVIERIKSMKDEAIQQAAIENANKKKKYLVKTILFRKNKARTRFLSNEFKEHPEGQCTFYSFDE